MSKVCKARNLLSHAKVLNTDIPRKRKRTFMHLNYCWYTSLFCDLICHRKVGFCFWNSNRVWGEELSFFGWDNGFCSRSFLLNKIARRSISRINRVHPMNQALGSCFIVRHHSGYMGSSNERRRYIAWAHAQNKSWCGLPWSGNDRFYLHLPGPLHWPWAIINLQKLQWSDPNKYGWLHHRIHFMMTSSNGNIFRVIGPCVANSPVIGEFPTQRPVTRSFDVFFDLRPNKRLSKQ